MKLWNYVFFLVIPRSFPGCPWGYDKREHCLCQTSSTFLFSHFVYYLTEPTNLGTFTKEILSYVSVLSGFHSFLRTVYSQPGFPGLPGLSVDLVHRFSALGPNNNPFWLLLVASFRSVMCLSFCWAIITLGRVVGVLTCMVSRGTEPQDLLVEGTFVSFNGVLGLCGGRFGGDLILSGCGSC